MTMEGVASGSQRVDVRQTESLQLVPVASTSGVFPVNGLIESKGRLLNKGLERLRLLITDLGRGVDAARELDAISLVRAIEGFCELYEPRLDPLLVLGIPNSYVDSKDQCIGNDIDSVSTSDASDIDRHAWALAIELVDLASKFTAVGDRVSTFMKISPCVS